MRSGYVRESSSLHVSQDPTVNGDESGVHDGESVCGWLELLLPSSTTGL